MLPKFTFSIRQQSIACPTPLVVRHRTISIRDMALLCITWPDGQKTNSEISPLPGLSPETLKESCEKLEHILYLLNQQTIDWCNLTSAFFLSSQQTKDLPSSALIALEWNFLQRWWQHHPTKKPENMQASSHQLISTQKNGAATSAILKCKIGRMNFSDEIFFLKELLQKNPLIKLRLDANQSLDLATWEYYVRELPSSSIDYWEEPLAPEFWPEWSVKKHLQPIPHLAFDESVLEYTLKGELPILPQKPKALIVRPTLCRGLSGCLELLDWCRKNCILATITTSYEGDLGLKPLHWLATQGGFRGEIHGLQSLETLIQG